MNHKRPFIDGVRQSWLKWLAVIVIFVAFICALWVNFGIRAVVEANDKTVGLVVDYDELFRLADGNKDTSFGEILKDASLAGATGIVVRERLLAEWETAGDLIVFSGRQLRFQIEDQYGVSASDMIMGFEIIPAKTYILTKDELVRDQLYSLLEVKARYPEMFTIPGYMGIAVQLHSSERATLGLGFPIAQLKEAADVGFQIIPRLRNWEPLTEESLSETMRWVAMIPNLAAIGFNDQSVPGDGTDPEKQELLADAVASLGKPLVSFEFYDQVGLPGLAERLDNYLLRAHAISDNEIRRYADFQIAMDRYSLAATERNIRYIYLRFQGLANPSASTLSNMELISGVRDGLISDGLKIGNPETIPAYTIGRLPMFLLGAGVIAAGGWLLALAATTFAKNKWRLRYCILMVAGCLVWAALIFIAPTLSKKAIALAGAIVFPSLSVLLVLSRKQGPRIAETGVNRVLHPIGQLLVMSVMTLAGAMIMSAVMAEPTFMLRLDMFRGTKVSHITPLILVPLILWLREEDWYGIMSGTVKSSVKYWQLIVGVILLVGLAVYILRTGNESPELVSSFEVRIRQVLDNILGVRPRTKEFLIGHPIMIVLLYYGYKLEMFPLVMVGLIGQVSLINTYAHLHTPIMVSLLRSANGLWIGIIIGIIAIVILEWISRRMHTLKSKYAKGCEAPEGIGNRD